MSCPCEESYIPDVTPTTPCDTSNEECCSDKVELIYAGKESSKVGARHKCYTSFIDICPQVAVCVSKMKLCQLADVSDKACTPAKGDILYWDGTQWINKNFFEILNPDGELPVARGNINLFSGAWGSQFLIKTHEGVNDNDLRAE